MKVYSVTTESTQMTTAHHSRSKTRRDMIRKTRLFTPGPKEMGPVIKAVQAKLQAAGRRAEGRIVSELVKKQLAG